MPAGYRPQSQQKGTDWHRPSAPVTARAGLPETRLRRLGADVDRLAVWSALWDRLDEMEGAREQFVDQLGTLTDGELETMVAGQPVFGEARTVTDLDGWARKAPCREIAAALAIVVEEARDGGGRDSLLKRLAGIR